MTTQPPAPPGRGSAPPTNRLGTLALMILWASFGFVPTALAGPFDDLGHEIHEMNAWATAVHEIARGPQHIDEPEGLMATAGSDTNVLGEATGAVGDTLSLGDGGSITVFLGDRTHNGPANDFAVFENGFFDLPGLFAELAFVEVSSNGVDFARFEVDALNPNPVGPFNFLDPTEYAGLAGRHEAYVGTGFDLADLAADPLVASGAVDLMDVRYVRVVDVIGDGSTVDAQGFPIYDPFPTPFSEGGFDLEAVGVIHVPEPNVPMGLAVGLCALLLFASRAGTRSTWLAAATVAVFVAGPAAALVSTFDDLGLGVESFENGAGLAGAGGFTSGGIFYENDYSAPFYTGFAASTTTDNTTPGFTNQYSNITGGGAGGSDGFAILFLSANIVLPSVQTVLGAEFTNTTYAAPIDGTRG